jgi:hypothetical protein
MFIQFLLALFFITQADSFNETKKIDWLMLADMTMEYRYNEEFGFDIPYPVFGDDIKAYEGQEVSLEGFVLLIEAEDEEIVILSKYPYSQCFFCGGAGPESVVDVLLVDKDHGLRMDQRVTFKGTLKLNVEDLDHLNYILEFAELVLD